MGIDIMSVLQWIIPAGSFGSVLVWLTNKTLRNLRTAKETHDTYKIMYQDTKQTLVEIQNEKKELLKMRSRFERALSRCFSCRYYDICPAIHELQKHKTGLGTTIERLSTVDRKTNRRARDNPDEPGDSSDTDGHPP